MSMFQIDYSVCDKDGICVIECPARILEMGDSGPVPVEGAEEICIQCGHCVAICPKSAFRADFLTPEECVPIERGQTFNKEQAGYFLRSRRSIRNYKKKPVPRDLFEKALEIACCSPTGSNNQPVRWQVYENREDVQKIAAHTLDWMRHVVQAFPEIAQALNMERLIEQCEQGIDRICRDAPQMVFAYASNEYGSAAADCHTALAYLELALPSVGLGSCWAGYVNRAATMWEPLMEMLALPENHTCHGAVMVGIPKFRYQRIPIRNKPEVVYI